MTRILELFGHQTPGDDHAWPGIVQQQQCPYLNRTCIKVRKSQPETCIGTCTVRHGKDYNPLLICPYRLLERKQIFTDCLHLLTLHEPGNQLHVVPEISVPGGSVDYFLVSAKGRKVLDFVGIELQTLDTTGTVWPERQRFLQECGLPVEQNDVSSTKSFGVNWKMTAKTILVQLHHKIGTFESFSKHLVLVVQDHLLSYMRREFSFDHLNQARLGDPMHLHAYTLADADGTHQLSLAERLSTNTAGIETCLGLQVSADVELEEIIEVLESKISADTLLTL